MLLLLLFLFTSTNAIYFSNNFEIWKSVKISLSTFQAFRSIFKQISVHLLSWKNWIERRKIFQYLKSEYKFRSDQLVSVSYDVVDELSLIRVVCEGHSVFFHFSNSMARGKTGPRNAGQRAVARQLREQLEAVRSLSTQGSSQNNSNTIEILSSSDSESSNYSDNENEVEPKESKRFSDLAQTDKDTDDSEENKCQYNDKDGRVKSRYRPGKIFATWETMDICIIGITVWFPSGARALQEIRYYQAQTGLAIPKAAFSRAARQVLVDMGKKVKFTVGSLAALQVCHDRDRCLLVLLTIFPISDG